NEEIKIILGGHQATSLPKETLETFSCFDIMVIGEGEETLLELVKELEKGTPDLKKIKGIAYRESDKITINPKRDLIKELDSIPFPSRELINFSRYRPPTKAYYSKPFAAMITSRGCPFYCTFCAYAKGVCRLRSPENVIGEIKELVRKYKVKSILFYDDTLTFDKERLIKICDLIIKNNFDLKWTCYSRVNAVSPSLLEKMKSAGCELISYGVESGSQRMLNIMKKGITLEQIEKAITMTKKTGIKTSASYVLGIPGETKESISQTIAFAKKLNTTFAHFNMITPWPGTELYNRLLKENQISENEWKKYAQKLGMHIPTVDLGEMTTDELKKFPIQAYRKFYLRPEKIWELAVSGLSFYKIKSYLLAFKALLRLR
ncbi:MAG: hypothetical protein A3E90_03265, partial [Candidatus Portnoybacteria bacterium RIFCSPHIGHO2_12_FULL_40_11]